MGAKSKRTAAIVIGGLALGGGLSDPVKAAPIETYIFNTGIGGGANLGTVKVTQIDLNDVSVDVQLAPNLLINSGGPHTPFAFNLTTALATALNAAGGNAVTVTAPVGAACSPAPSPCFAPDYAAGG